MFDVTFQQDILKLAVDKVFDIVILVLVGQWVNRAFEHYKANEEIRTKIAEKRVTEIAEIWDKLENIYIEATRVLLSSNEIIRQEQPTWTPKEVRAHMDQDQLPEPTIKRLKEKHEATLTNLISETKALQSQIALKDFWLGKSAREFCLRNVKSIASYLSDINKLISGQMGFKLSREIVHSSFGVLESKVDIVEILRAL